MLLDILFILMIIVLTPVAILVTILTLGFAAATWDYFRS